MQAVHRLNLHQPGTSLSIGSIYLPRHTAVFNKSSYAQPAKSSRIGAVPQHNNNPPRPKSAPSEARSKRQRLHPVAYQPALRVGSSWLQHQSPNSSNSSLQNLQDFLGYQFKNEQLLAQACTHSSDKQALSYRQLAFVGDAALWMLFAEHAFHVFGAAEDPSSGAWATHMSALLSRANCAATARQWGLQQYLQHSSGTSSSSTSSSQRSGDSFNTGSSSSTSKSSGMYNGAWSSDTLAEMFEGVVGALLMDSSYATVQQLLQPWVAAAFDASRAAAAAAVAAQQPMMQSDLRSSSSSSSTACWIQQEQLAVLLHEQLQQRCGYCFRNNSIVHTCARHVLQLLSHGDGEPQSDKWHFLGYSLVRFAAAQHAYAQQYLHKEWPQQQREVHQQQQQQQQQQWFMHGWQRQQPVVAAAAVVHECSSSTSSQANRISGSSSDYDSSSSSSNSLSRCSSSSSCSSSMNQVQLMSKQMEKLTTIRHRCKMWLWLGLDPVSWCRPGSYVLSSKWKLQKQVLSRCLDLLVAAVYLDGGMDAALRVLDVLLRETPPTRLDKSWIPSWAQRQS